jgi:hypothetical protein
MVSPPKNKKLVNTGVSFIGVRPLRSSILVFLIQVLVFYLILGESFEILFLAVFYLKIIFMDFEIRNKKRFNPLPPVAKQSPLHPPTQITNTWRSF